MPLRPLLCCLFLAALLGCGGGSDTALCDKVGGALTAFATKAAPCASGVTISYTQQQCLSALGSCSASDKQKLGTFADCLNALPACTTATAATWSTSTQNCLTPLTTLSTACQ